MDPFTTAALSIAGKKFAEYIAQEHTCEKCSRLSANVYRTTCCSMLLCKACLNQVDFWKTNCCGKLLCDSCVERFKANEGECKFCGKSTAATSLTDNTALILGTPVNSEYLVNSNEKKDTTMPDQLDFATRRQLLGSLVGAGAILTDSIPLYQTSSILLTEKSALKVAGKTCGSWIEAIKVTCHIDPYEFDSFLYYPILKHIIFSGAFSGDRFNDKCIYVLSQIEPLRHIEFPRTVKEISPNGLNHLRKLRHLEYVKLPTIIGDPDSRKYDHTLKKKFRDALVQMLPDVVIEI